MNVVVKKTEAKVVRNGRSLALYFAAKNEVLPHVIERHVLIKFDNVVVSGKIRRTNSNTGVFNLPKKVSDLLKDMIGRVVEIEVVYYVDAKEGGKEA